MSDRPTKEDKPLPVMGEETEYYQRINVMLVDLGTETLLKLLKSLVPDGNVKSFLKSKSDELKKQFHKDQCRRLLSDTLVETELDIALLIKLMQTLLPQELRQAQMSGKVPPLAADLQILKGIRNKLIGHRPAAKITEGTFRKEWNTISLILKRILPGSHSKKELDERIEHYMTSILPPETVKKILDKLEELSNVIKQMKALGKQVEEFKLFFEQLPEIYKSYVMLLFDGGKLVLRGVLHREMEKKKYTFDKLVQENQEKFPRLLSPEMTLSSLDVSVLPEIILTLFGESVSKSDKTEIECIRNARYSYADSARISLNNNEFTLSKVTPLTFSLKFLAMNIDEKSRDEYYGILEKCQKEGYFSDIKVDEYLNQLKAEGGMGIRTLQEVYEAMCSEVNILYHNAEEEDLPLDEKVNLHVVVCCKNLEVKRLAENQLKSDIQKIISGGDAKQNKSELHMLVRELEGQDGVTITEVYTKCITIVLHLPTYSATNHLINFVESQQFGRLIEQLSRMLSLEYEEAISMQGRLTFESMARLSNHMRQQGKRHLNQENVQDNDNKRTKIKPSVTRRSGRIITTKKEISI